MNFEHEWVGNTPWDRQWDISSLGKQVAGRYWLNLWEISLVGTVWVSLITGIMAMAKSKQNTALLPFSLSFYLVFILRRRRCFAVFAFDGKRWCMNETGGTWLSFIPRSVFLDDGLCCCCHRSSDGICVWCLFFFFTRIYLQCKGFFVLLLFLWLSFHSCTRTGSAFTLRKWREGDT